MFKNKDSKKSLIDQTVIQRDWEDREVVETINLRVMDIMQFLNNFDGIVRTKVSTMNEKLTHLERKVEYCEAAIKTSQDRAKREGRP